MKTRAKWTRPLSLVVALARVASGWAAARKYQQAAEKLSELYAKLSAKSAEVGKAAQAVVAGGSSQSQLLQATLPLKTGPQGV